MNKAVYGLNDAPLKWYERLDKELITLGCVHSKLDTACYIYREEGQLAGMACIYIDDVIAAGNKTFNEKVLCGLKDVFLIVKTEESFRYVGTNIGQQGDRINHEFCSHPRTVSGQATAIPTENVLSFQNNLNGHVQYRPFAT